MALLLLSQSNTKSISNGSISEKHIHFCHPFSYVDCLNMFLNEQKVKRKMKKKAKHQQGEKQNKAEGKGT